MSLVLAVEPDPTRAQILRSLVRERVDAELVLVTSAYASVVAMNRQVPDLVLVGSTLPSSSQETITSHLKSLCGDAVVIAPIPALRGGEERESSRFGFRWKRAGASESGVDSATFAKRINEWVARGQERKAVAAPVRTPTAFKAPAARDAAPATPAVLPDVAAATGTVPVRDAAFTDDLVGTPGAHAEAATPVAVHGLHAVATEALAPDTALTGPAGQDDDPSMVSPQDDGGSSLPTLELLDQDASLDAPPAASDHLLVRTAAGDDLAAVGVSSTEPELILLSNGGDETPIAREREPAPDAAAALEEAERRLAAELARVQQEADAQRLEELARLEAEAEAARLAAVEEARSAAEYEARQALAAELSRVRSDAEREYEDAMALVRSEAERDLADEVARVRDHAEAVRRAELERIQRDADERFEFVAKEAKEHAEAEASRVFTEELSRVHAQAEATLAAELRRVRAEAETTLANQVSRVRAEADQLRDEQLAMAQAEAEALRAAATREARSAAEEAAARALEQEVHRVRADAEARLGEELERVKAEAERQRLEAEHVRLIERSEAEIEAQRMRDTAAREARQAAEAAAAMALDAEVDRLRAEADAKLQAELERVRLEAERARERERSEAQAEHERFRDATAREARQAAEEATARAVEAELTRMRLDAEASLRVEIARARAEAEDARRAEEAAKQVAEQAREQAALEARTAAEAAAAKSLEAELGRLRAEAEDRIQSEIVRVRGEADEARQDQAEARAEAERLREAAAREAEALAELKAEIVRERADADARFEVEMRKLRAETERRQATELQELKARLAEMGQAAAAQARLAAASHFAGAGPFDTPGRTAGTGRPQDPWMLMPDRHEAPPVVTGRAAGSVLPPQASTSISDRSFATASGRPRRSSLPPVTDTEEARARKRRWRRISIAACILLFLGNAVSFDLTPLQEWSARTMPDAITSRIATTGATASTAIAAPVPGTERPAPGTLTVESSPAGAQVLVDGTARGTAPLTLTDLRPGRHTVVLRSAAGAVSRTVTIRAGRETTLSEDIVSGFLAVFSRIPLDILVAGRRIGATGDGEILLPPGHYEVSFVNERFNYYGGASLDVRPGQVTSHTVSLPMGVLRVATVEGAEIWVEGQLAGEAPLPEILVPIGTREVIVRTRDRGERREAIEIRQGAPTQVTIQF